jgi:hypothetical protein
VTPSVTLVIYIYIFRELKLKLLPSLVHKKAAEVYMPFLVWITCLMRTYYRIPLLIKTLFNMNFLINSLFMHHPKVTNNKKYPKSFCYQISSVLTYLKVDKLQSKTQLQLSVLFKLGQTFKNNL